MRIIAGMSHVPVETLDEDAADLQFPKGLLHIIRKDAPNPNGFLDPSVSELKKI